MCLTHFNPSLALSNLVRLRTVKFCSIGIKLVLATSLFLCNIAYFELSNNDDGDDDDHLSFTSSLVGYLDR